MSIRAYNSFRQVLRQDLRADWIANGRDFLVMLRELKPEVYLRFVVSELWKHPEIREDPLDELSDAQLDAIITYANNALGCAAEGETAEDDKAR